MLVTLARRIVVRSLDAVVDRGRASRRGPVRAVADVLDRARSVAGLDVIEPRSPMPAWTGTPAPHPMWDSDKKRLAKWRQQMGYDAPDEEEVAAAEAKAAEPALKVYYTRGCPHARAAMDLLREREIPFGEVDVKGDDATRSWLAIVTGSKTVPQIFVHGAPIGGHDELRELDQAGKLRALVDGPPEPVAEVKASLGRVKLPVVQQHPDHSPFESLDGDLGQALEEELEGEALVDAVKEVLDECRPMVQADGGDIVLLDVQGSVVHVELTGNCVGCPSSQATLRQGIERRLKARIPGISGIASPQLQPSA